MGAVAVASKMGEEKRWSRVREPPNWSWQNEDPFPQWEVQNQTPEERNPHARQDYSQA